MPTLDTFLGRLNFALPDRDVGSAAIDPVLRWIENYGRDVSVDFECEFVLAANKRGGVNPASLGELPLSIYPVGSPVVSAEVTRPLNAAVHKPYGKHDGRGPYIQLFDESGAGVFTLESMPLLQVLAGEDHVTLARSNACASRLVYENDAQDTSTQTIADMISETKITLNTPLHSGYYARLLSETIRPNGHIVTLNSELRLSLVEHNYHPCLLPQDGKIRRLVIEGEGGADIHIGDVARYNKRDDIPNVPNARYVFVGGSDSPLVHFSLFPEQAPGQVTPDYRNMKAGFYLVNPGTFSTLKFTHRH